MTLNITSKHMTITPAIRSHVEEKFSKLYKWHTHLINPHFVLSKGPSFFTVDGTITTKGSQLVASAQHDDMYTAINEVIHKLERQLNKSQHKTESRRAFEGHKQMESDLE